MRYQCYKIKIIKEGDKKSIVKFLDTGVVMPIPLSILKTKIKNGFYKVVGKQKENEMKEK